MLVGQARAAEDAGHASEAADLYHDASVEIGLMSHFITDVLQPFHAAYAGLDDPHNYHHAYEMLVGNGMWRGKDWRPEWQPTSRSVSAISNSRTVAISAAAYSRSLFPSLMSHLEANRGASLDDREKDITRAVFRRAAQDLANLIWSIDQQVGDAPMATLSLTVTHRYAGGRVAVTTKATAPSGKAIEGLVLEITAPKAGGGTVTRSRATGPDGTAVNWFDAVGSYYNKQPLTVKAISLGTTILQKTWYMRTPSLASFSLRMADYSLAKGQTARAAAVAKDGSGPAGPRHPRLVPLERRRDDEGLHGRHRQGRHDARHHEGRQLHDPRPRGVRRPHLYAVPRLHASADAGAANAQAASRRAHSTQRAPFQ